LFILGHNVWTTNNRKLVKGSKDSDSSLVSNENLSKILPSCVWALDQVTLAKMAKNLPYFWHYSQKKTTQKQKNFFHCRFEDLLWGYEQLSSTIRWGAMQLVRTEVCSILGWFPSTIYSYAGNQGVNTLRAGLWYIRTSI